MQISYKNVHFKNVQRILSYFVYSQIGVLNRFIFLNRLQNRFKKRTGSLNRFKKRTGLLNRFKK
jgi:hypothetical protein